MLLKNEALLKSIAENDEIVLKRFIASNFKSLVLFVKNNGGTMDDAEDLMQDAVIVLHGLAKKGNVKIEKRIEDYFRGIYKNLWYKKVKEKKYQMIDIDSKYISQTEFIVSSSFVINEINKNDRYNLYYKHYQRLNEDCKKIIEMINDGIQLPEIAKAFNFTLSYFYKKKSLCKKELFEMIKRDPEYNELKYE